MTVTLQSNEKPRRAQLRAGRGCDRRFVRGGRLDAPGGSLTDVDDFSAALGSVSSEVGATLDGRGLGLVLAPDGKLVRGATVSDDKPLMRRATALFPVFAGGCGFGFRGGFAAEATQFLCCFVFHGKRTIPKRLGYASGKMQNLKFSSPNTKS